jgi:two-component system NtrC family response regulator
VPVDVRVVCATHHDLGECIKAGTFREDLYYRVSEIVIRIPSLRDREGDRILLARTFLEKYAGEHGRTFRGFSEKACELIEAYDWPGNVRELENRVKRAVVLADGKTISVSDLGFQGKEDIVQGLDLREAREDAESKVIRRALDIYNYNMSRTADALGVSRPSLYSLMKKLGIESAGK